MEATSREPDTGSAAAGRARGDDDRHSRRYRGETRTGGDALMQDVAKAWIRDHQDAALLAAFAVGVFIGAWMRG